MGGWVGKLHEYHCVFEHGRCDWLPVPPEHEQLQIFKQKMLELGPLSEQPGAIQFESMVEFMAPDLIPDKNEIIIPEL